MRSNLIARAVFAASIAAGVLLATAVTPAAAREGSARSIGNGIKCRTIVTISPDGTRTASQYCYKGV